jgi:lysophospholipase L1-like esterase
LPLVDIEKTVPRNLEYFVDDVHFTSKAAKLIASAIKQKILTEGILERD